MEVARLPFSSAISRGHLQNKFRQIEADCFSQKMARYIVRNCQFDALRADEGRMATLFVGQVVLYKLCGVPYSQVPNKQVGPNKRIGWLF